MAKRQRRSRPQEKVYDRRSGDLPINAAVVSAVVDDPYSIHGEKIEVLRSVRDDPIAGMLARAQIDQAQFAAGRRWQREHEAAGIGAVSAIDPTKEPVDGHGPSRLQFTDRQLNAFRELKHADQALGLEGGALVRDVLGSRLTIAEAAERRGCVLQEEIKYIRRRFVECLETLALCWGYAAKKQATTSTRGPAQN